MEKNKTDRRSGWGLGIGEAIKRGISKRKGDKLSVVYDLLIVLLAFLFSRCHAIFGAYPLAISFIAALPSGVWLALVGAAAGSLTLGNVGIINAVICVVVVLLRIIISGGERRGGTLFSESLILRAAAATIGSFIGAIYEILLSGFVVSSVLYGSASVLLAALFTALLSGVFCMGTNVGELVGRRMNFFKKGEKKDTKLLLFQASALLYVVLISYSLKEYDLFGISSGYVFAAMLTLATARRFGPIRAMTVGFASSFALSGAYSVAFALAGAVSGLLFSLGVGYALIGGGVVLSAWSAYVGGALGFLTTFPEYSFSAMLLVPVIKRITPEGELSVTSQPIKTSEDMVNAIALSYRSSSDSSEALSDSLKGCARILRKVGEREGRLTVSEYRDVVIKCESSFCPSCPSYSVCLGETPAPCIEFADAVATKLYKKEKLFANDPSISARYCHAGEELFCAITRAAADAERERERNRRIVAVAEEYELLSRLMYESRRRDIRESAQNVHLTELLSGIVEHSGLSLPAAMVLGEDRPHFIIAGGDKDGNIVTSEELHKEIEEKCGVRLGDYEYFRRGDVALLECAAKEKYSVDFFAAGKRKSGESASGDAVSSTSDGKGRFIAMISDGMGSGEEAHATSQLTSELVTALLSAGARRQTALHVVNHLMKSRAVECSATVDLFDFDLITGEAVFYKCGAAPSYVKRGDSIFRIKSETVPIGIAGSIDAERIRVEVEAGDIVVMLSDGIAGGIEDGAWLLEVLARPTLSGVREYAEELLSEAEGRAPLTDDATVAVMRITKCDTGVGAKS